MDDIILFEGFGGHMLEVLTALVPLLVCFLVFIIILKIEIKNIRQTVIGIIFAVVGLGMFLHGVHIGFLPTGELIGQTLAGGNNPWTLIPVGFVLGFVATIAEPAVRIMNYEVEKVSGGSIKANILLITLSLGVGLVVALAMLRILFGWPLWMMLLPGYILAFIMAFFVSNKFVSIGFDAGGVATGPMTVTFILALAVGAAQAIEGRDPLIEGFGLVALVALAPILAVLTLGLVYDSQAKKMLGKE